MADVFISYKSERRRVATYLARVLEGHGYTVWYDYHLVAGRNFPVAIAHELQEARAVIVLWCSLSIKSEWVYEEATWAKNRNRLIPAKLEDVDPPLGFTVRETLDLTAWEGGPASRHLRKLLGEVENRVRPPRRDAEKLADLEKLWWCLGELRPLQFPLVDSLADQDAPPQSALSSRLRPGSVWRDEIPGLAQDATPLMVTLPPGKYRMGLPQDKGRPDEYPQHEVEIDYVLAIGRHPVTFQEWDAARAMGAPITDPGDQWGRGRRPVINVSWRDAKAYIGWLNTMLGLTGSPNAYRLPSEAEWEYACRAGTSSLYSFGDVITPRQAQFADGGVGKAKYTVPVGLLPANDFGLHEMHGNVWEWCEDWWSPGYVDAPRNGLPWIAGDSARRVLRGGSWVSGQEQLRSAYRDHRPLGFSSDSVGFRLARTIAA